MSRVLVESIVNVLYIIHWLISIHNTSRSAYFFVFSKFSLECLIRFIAQIVLQFFDEAGHVSYLAGL